MLVMKSGKRYMTDGKELPNHDTIRTLEENETYKYLGILEADTIKQVQMKDTIRKEYLRRMNKTTRDKTLRQKPHQRNKYLGCAPCQIFGTVSQAKQMDQTTRKLMTMHKALHPRDDVGRLYVFRKEGGRGLASIKDIVDASIQQLEDYIKNTNED